MNCQISSDLCDCYKHIGEYLKKERLARNISLQEITDSTKIPTYRFVSIEENRCHELPAEIFVKGFIKSYAEYIGLDTVDVMNRYNECRTGSFADGDAADVTQHTNSFMQIFNTYGRPVTVSLILIALIAGLWFFRGELKNINGNSVPAVSSAEASDPFFNGSAAERHKQASDVRTERAEVSASSKQTDI